ncbi:MAG TPA: HEAT repeat domain-containing protein [Planctomycetota bacterium]|nr:HEAT repeat domain-containing protein [Planctomycetota bacterium]
MPTGGAGAPTTPGRPAYTGPLGPTAGGPAAPRSPGASAPLVPGAPGSPASTQPRSPRGNGVTSDDPGSWRVWWTLNHDRFIDVAAHAPIATGDGARTAVLAEARADAYERLAPIVTRVIQQEKNEILLGRALIAIAKLGENPRIANSREVYKLILPFVSNDKTKVAESAAVALGILGHDDAVMALSQYATTAPNSKTDAVRADRVRTFALYGLGLVARDAKREDVRRVAASRLCAIFSGEKGMAVDVKVACLQALSLVPLASDTLAMALPGGELEIPSASRNAEVEWVLRVLDSTSEATWVRAQAATTSARLCADQPETSKLRARVADRLIESLMFSTHDGLAIRQSAALALGGIGDSDDDAGDVEIRNVLAEASASNADQATRYYSMMSLAQVASRPGGAVDDPERLDAAKSVRSILLKRAASGNESDRAWSALSLGVFEYRLRQAGEATSADSCNALISMLQNTRSPEVAGAASLALGLAGAGEAKDLLIEQLKSNDASVRGFAALSLGLLGIREAVPALEKVLERAEGVPEVFVPVSEGLAMLGAPVTDRLVKSLTSGLSLEAQLAACIALGRTGGSRAVQPLSDLVGDATGTAWVRALAVEALGSIGDHGATRWNARYAFDVNFLALPLTETAPNFDGVLDLE